MSEHAELDPDELVDLLAEKVAERLLPPPPTAEEQAEAAVQAAIAGKDFRAYLAARRKAPRILK